MPLTGEAKRQHNREYYQRKKSIINSRNKRYYQEHKEEFKEKYQEHKEEFKEKYQKHKEEIKEKYHIKKNKWFIILNEMPIGLVI